MSRSIMQSGPIPSSDIERAKEDIVGTIAKYVKLKKSGKDYVGLCPFHAERTPSFTVSEVKGFYHCHGCGAHGDAIDFVMNHEGILFPEAVNGILGSINVSGTTSQKYQVAHKAVHEEWTPMSPVPSSACLAPFSLGFDREPDAVWTYSDAVGNLIGFIRRLDRADGKKTIMPLSYCSNAHTGEFAWKPRAFCKPRPLYGLDKLAKHKKAQVIVVEGEKAADAAQDLFEASGISRDRLIVISWPGGSGSVKHADWSPMYGRRCGLWPDADEVGAAAMVQVGRQLRNHVDGKDLKVFKLPAGVVDGWDLADEFPEGFALLEHVKQEGNKMLFSEFEKHVDGARGEAQQVAIEDATAAERQAVVDVPGAGAGSSLSTQEDSRDGGLVDPVDSIAANIASRLVSALSIAPMDSDSICKLGVDTRVIGRMIRGAFWSGSKSKLFLLNDSQNLNQFLVGEAYKFLVHTFGSPVDDQAISDLMEEAIAARGLNNAQQKALRSAVREAAETVILDHLKHYNQRDSVEWRCDMFAQEAAMHLLEDKVRIVLAHKPFEMYGTYEQSIIDDYKQHFSRFDEFLEFLVQSRFALDRKKCYLWILADSDWGKGFLLGVLNRLHTSVTTSMREIEAMFEGRPVGRVPEEFKRAFVLVVDEFKTVKSELKQLQSEITLAPKNQLTASVEVFAKVFLSAESVASLVTENGVEDQFANRMSIFAGTGSLVKRPLYVEVGNPRYFASVLAYSAEALNRMVAKMQAMGLEESQTHAERWINEFIKRNGIDTVYERFSDSLSNFAKEVVSWMLKQHSLKGNYLLSEGRGENCRYYLQSASKKLDEYLSEHCDTSEIYAYRRRKPEILKGMSADGKGAYPHTVNGIQVKAVKLRSVGEGGHLSGD